MTAGTYLARAYQVLKRAPGARRSADFVAGAAGMELKDAQQALVLLVTANKAARAGVSDHGDALYQYVPRSEKPIDGRGRHHKHLTGAKWAVRRKQRANLAKAREAKRRHITANGTPLVMGVRIGGKNGR